MNTVIRDLRKRKRVIFLSYDEQGWQYENALADSEKLLELEPDDKKLNLEMKENSKFRFYDGKTECGTEIKLPNWQYPIIVKNNGEVIFDNYNGNWGDIKELQE